MEINFKDKNALVLGASSGIGYSIASQIATLGGKILLVGRNTIKLEQAVAQIKLNSSNQGIFGISADLTQENSVNDIVDKAHHLIDKLDFLILNTGGPTYHESILEVPAQEWYQYFQSMFMSQIKLVESFMPEMKQHGFGRIIAIGSSSIIEPIPGLGISNSLRPALIAWLKTLSLEVAAHGITINSVIPGKIDTERLAHLEAKRGKSISNIPMARYGTVTEMANAAVFLLSDYASYTTGSSIVIDGGMLKRSV